MADPNAPAFTFSQDEASDINLKEGDVTSKGEFVGGFQGCVKHMMATKNIPQSNAERLCAYIGRQSGKIPAKKMEEAITEAEKCVKEEDDKAAADAKQKMEEAVAQARKETEAKIMGFAELTDVQIFATGTHHGRTFTKTDLEVIAKNFAEFGKKIQPPLVLGHDEDQKILQNSGLPALGWLKDLRVVDRNGSGAVLVGNFQDVPEVARKVITERRYKRISAELYDDFKGDDGKGRGLTLRRVALLGADVPEVKTLADVTALSEACSLVYAFSEGGTQMPDPDSKKVAEDLALKLAEAEKRNKELTDALAKESIEKHRAAISSFCEGLKRDGRLLPKWEEMGLSKFLEGLDSTKVSKFSEAKESKEMSALDWMKEFMAALPKLVKLEEEAGGAGAAAAAAKQGGAALSTALDAAAKDFMTKSVAAGTPISYAEAVRAVAKANPSLVE